MKTSDRTYRWSFCRMGDLMENTRSSHYISSINHFSTTIQPFEMLLSRALWKTDLRCLWRQLVRVQRSHCCWAAQPQLTHLQHNPHTWGSENITGGAERLLEPEDQEVCCKIVSPRNNWKDTPMKPQPYCCLSSGSSDRQRANMGGTNLLGSHLIQWASGI